MLFATTMDIRKFISEKSCGVNLSFLISEFIAGSRTAVFTRNILPTEGDSPRIGFNSLTQSY